VSAVAAHRAAGMSVAQFNARRDALVGPTGALPAGQVPRARVNGVKTLSN
jgi:hypothetical protein